MMGCDEFDCVDCERHMIAFPVGTAAKMGHRCALCFNLPGWFLVDELRTRLEDSEWRPPERLALTGDDPARWRCEVPGCDNRSPLMRVSGYDEPFRGRCGDHLAPAIFQELHRRRNSEAAHPSMLVFREGE